LLVGTQKPLLQVSPEGHLLLQVPQLFGSVMAFTHAVRGFPHAKRPVAQAHTPLLQKLCAGMHLLPQVPQLFESVERLVQVPLHDVCPDPHTVEPVQVPPLQSWPAPHAVPQDPQLDGSEDVVSQKPEHKVPGHESVSPDACILYSTSRLASAPVLAGQVEPVRSNACNVAPAANVRTMGPLSDQF